MSYLLGIDVGTTRTAAAIARVGGGSSEIEAVNLGDRSSAIPSVLYLADDGSVVVGEAAERRAVTDPDRVVREFKRRIGDPTPVIVAGRPWAPEELSARLARWVVDRVAQREGGPATRVAITHPASWGPHKKELFAGALARHGLQVMFLAEPQAAAMHYATAERVDPGSTIAVYDLGGGTFDAAVVHKDAGGFSLVGRPEGLAQLGGIDFDEAVFSHVVTGLPEAFENLDETDPAVLAAVAAVRRECSEAKEALSSDTDVAISVFMPAARGSVRLHRSEFEAMIRPQVEETVAALRRAVTSARLSPEQLSAVLLVGGSSRIPLVGELVSEQLGRPVAVDADPKNAIAKGAAVALLPPQAQTPAPRGATSGPMAAAAAGAMLPPQVGNQPDPALTGGYAPPPPRPPAQRAAGMGAAGMGGVPPRQMPPPPPRPQLDVPSYDHDSGPYDSDAYDSRADYDYRRREEPRRSPAFLVSVGGIAAAVAMMAALFLWRPSQPDAGTTGSESSIAPTSAEEPPSSAPVPTTTPGRTSSRPAPPPPATTRPPATTAPQTTQPPVTTQPTIPATTTPKPPASGASGAKPPPASAPNAAP